MTNDNRSSLLKSAAGCRIAASEMITSGYMGRVKGGRGECLESERLIELALQLSTAARDYYTERGPDHPFYAPSSWPVNVSEKEEGR